MNPNAIYMDSRESETYFYFSPDGIGRVFFTSLQEAKDETGLKKVLHLN